MRTSILQVSDGSIITFKITDLGLYAILTTPNGQVINGQPKIDNTELTAAREILLSNNKINPTSGEPLSYSVEGFQDQSNLNNKSDILTSTIPRLTMYKSVDETALNNAKINQEILKQDNEALNKALESELPPEVKFTNFINNQKSTIKKRLIPFVIELITPMAPQIIPIVVSQLGISGDSTVDSIKENAQAKKDEAQAKIDAAKDTANSAKETAKDKEKLKSIAAGAAPSLLALIPTEQLINLIKCPSSAKIQSIVKQRNALVNQINGIFNIVKNLNNTQKITAAGITALTVGLNLIAIAPPNTVPGAFLINHEKLTTALKVAKTVVNTVTLTLVSFGVFLGIILKFLSILDVLLQFCAEDKNMNFEQINDEINALANSTIQATQSNSDNQDINTYKGFTLGIKIDETNESKYIRRYAVAQNKQGVPVLRTDSSFASDPAVLISQLKFIIDSNPSITAE